MASLLLSVSFLSLASNSRGMFFNLSQVQNEDPCACDCEDCGKFFREVLTIGVSAICAFASIAVVAHYLLYVRQPRQQSGYERIDD